MTIEGVPPNPSGDTIINQTTRWIDEPNLNPGGNILLGSASNRITFEIKNSTVNLNAGGGYIRLGNTASNYKQVTFKIWDDSDINFGVSNSNGIIMERITTGADSAGHIFIIEHSTVEGTVLSLTDYPLGIKLDSGGSGYRNSTVQFYYSIFRNMGDYWNSQRFMIDTLITSGAYSVYTTDSYVKQCQFYAPAAQGSPPASTHGPMFRGGPDLLCERNLFSGGFMNIGFTRKARYNYIAGGCRKNYDPYSTLSQPALHEYNVIKFTSSLELGGCKDIDFFSSYTEFANNICLTTGINAQEGNAINTYVHHNSFVGQAPGITNSTGSRIVDNISWNYTELTGAFNDRGQGSNTVSRNIVRGCGANAFRLERLITDTTTYNTNSVYEDNIVYSFNQSAYQSVYNMAMRLRRLNTANINRNVLSHGGASSSGNEYGIYGYDIRNTLFKQNKIYDTGVGIHLTSEINVSSNNTLEDNIFRNIKGTTHISLTNSTGTIIKNQELVNGLKVNATASNALTFSWTNLKPSSSYTFYQDTVSSIVNTDVTGAATKIITQPATIVTYRLMGPDTRYLYLIGTILRKSNAVKTYTINTQIQNAVNIQKLYTINVILQIPPALSKAYFVDSLLQKHNFTKSYILDIFTGVFEQTRRSSRIGEFRLNVTRLGEYVPSGSLISKIKTYLSDVWVLKTLIETYILDSFIKKLNTQKTYVINMRLLKIQLKTYITDIIIRNRNTVKTYNLSVRLLNPGQVLKSYQVNTHIGRIPFTKAYTIDTMLLCRSLPSATFDNPPGFDVSSFDNSLIKCFKSYTIDLFLIKKHLRGKRTKIIRP